MRVASEIEERIRRARPRHSRRDRAHGAVMRAGSGTYRCPGTGTKLLRVTHAKEAFPDACGLLDDVPVPGTGT